MTTTTLAPPSAMALIRLGRDVCRGRDLDALDALHIDWAGYGAACHAMMQERPPFTLPDPYRFLRGAAGAAGPVLTPAPTALPPFSPPRMAAARPGLPLSRPARPCGRLRGAWRRFVAAFWRCLLGVIAGAAVVGAVAIAYRALGLPGVVVASGAYLVGAALALPILKLVTWLEGER